MESYVKHNSNSINECHYYTLEKYKKVNIYIKEAIINNLFGDTQFYAFNPFFRIKINKFNC